MQNMFGPLRFITPIQIYKILKRVVSSVANQGVRMMRALGIKPSCKMDSKRMYFASNLTW
jgi:hypothetical protein